MGQRGGAAGSVARCEEVTPCVRIDAAIFTADADQVLVGRDPDFGIVRPERPDENADGLEAIRWVDAPSGARDGTTPLSEQLAQQGGQTLALQDEERRVDRHDADGDP